MKREREWRKIVFCERNLRIRLLRKLRMITRKYNWMFLKFERLKEIYEINSNQVDDLKKEVENLKFEKLEIERFWRNFGHPELKHKDEIIQSLQKERNKLKGELYNKELEIQCLRDQVRNITDKNPPYHL